MAHIPTPERIEEIQKITQSEIDKKLEAQIKLGKSFVPTGAGVIPEKIWKAMKK